jgi:hypothetical protein
MHTNLDKVESINMNRREYQFVWTIFILLNFHTAKVQKYLSHIFLYIIYFFILRGTYRDNCHSHDSTRELSQLATTILVLADRLYVAVIAHPIYVPQPSVVIHAALPNRTDPWHPRMPLSHA